MAGAVIALDFTMGYLWQRIRLLYSQCGLASHRWEQASSATIIQVIAPCYLQELSTGGTFLSATLLETNSWPPLLSAFFPSFSLFPTPNRPCQSARSPKACHVTKPILLNARVIWATDTWAVGLARRCRRRFDPRSQSFSFSKRQQKFSSLSRCSFSCCSLLFLAPVRPGYLFCLLLFLLSPSSQPQIDLVNLNRSPKARHEADSLKQPSALSD